MENQAKGQLTEAEFQERLNEKLKELTGFCAEHWGQAPELEARVIPAIKVTCDFDLGDFPHRGRSFLVHAGNAGGGRLRRLPWRSCGRSATTETGATGAG